MRTEESHCESPLLSRYRARNSCPATVSPRCVGGAPGDPLPERRCGRGRLRYGPWRSRLGSWWSLFVLTWRSLDQHEERLPLFDDIRGELRRVGGAYVPHRVDRFGRDEQDVASVERRRWLTLDLVLQRSFEDIDDLFAWMLVLEGRRFRANVHAVLDDFASGNAEIVLLEIGALDFQRLLLGAAHVTLRSLVVAGHRSRTARTICARRPRPPINVARRMRLASPPRRARALPKRRSDRPYRPR